MTKTSAQDVCLFTLIRICLHVLAKFVCLSMLRVLYSKKRKTEQQECSFFFCKERSCRQTKKK